MLGRMQAFLDSWIGQSKLYNFPSEIIIVEWNPPVGRPKLIDDLRWPLETEPCHVRFIDVPAEIHQRLPSPDAIPLHQMIAKNVGIRRARGEFILATNIDIVFSRELMRFLAQRALEPGKLYRIDRHDVSKDIPREPSVDELLDFCETHKLRVFTKEGTFTFDRDGLWNLEKNDIVAPDAGIRLQGGWFPVERASRGPYRWMEAETEVVLRRSRPRLLIDVETGPSAGGKPVEVEVLDEGGATLGSTSLEGRCILRLHVPDRISSSRLRFRIHGRGVVIERDLRFLNLRAFGLRWDSNGAAAKCGLEVLRRKSIPKLKALALRFRRPIQVGRIGSDWAQTEKACSPLSKIRNGAFLHTNSCGDFSLLSRHAWFALRGYAEFYIWPMHIDSLLCYAAYHSGIQEVVLSEPMRIFHIEHLTGAGWTPEGEAERQGRIERKGVDAISYADVTQWVAYMRRFDSPMIFNTCEWGLAGVQLAEMNPRLGPSP